MSSSTTSRPTLQYGSRGTAVVELQTLLNQRIGKLQVPGVTFPLVADGDFGAQTEKAVIAYQEQYSLTKDGIVGQRTWSSLLQTIFPDVAGHWAAEFITQLANAGVVRGDDLGKYNPNAAITRAQFAALLDSGFAPTPVVRPAKTFSDVPANFWAATAIRRAYQAGFISGYDDGTFRPNQNVLRQDMLITLANTLGTRRDGGPAVLNYYTDANSISAYARTGIILATLHGIVLNFPDLRTLSPVRPASRAEVAASLSRTLSFYVQKGAVVSKPIPKQPIDSPSVVKVVL